MKALLMLSLAGFSAWVAYKLHREAIREELPVSERKRAAWGGMPKAYRITAPVNVRAEERRRREAWTA